MYSAFKTLQSTRKSNMKESRADDGASPPSSRQGTAPVRAAQFHGAAHRSAFCQIWQFKRFAKF